MFLLGIYSEEFQKRIVVLTDAFTYSIQHTHKFNPLGSFLRLHLLLLLGLQTGSFARVFCMINGGHTFKEWVELPDTEMCTTGVVSTNRGDSACVCAYVTGPGLGDMEGTICIHPHARNRLHVDHDAILIPDMSRTECH